MDRAMYGASAQNDAAWRGAWTGTNFYKLQGASVPKSYHNTRLVPDLLCDDIHTYHISWASYLRYSMYIGIGSGNFGNPNPKVVLFFFIVLDLAK